LKPKVITAITPISLAVLNIVSAVEIMNAATVLTGKTQEATAGDLKRPAALGDIGPRQLQ